MVHDFVPCSPVSVPNQIIGDSCFNIFPQPASTELNFSIQKDSFRNYNNLLLIIYDVFGEIIYQNEMRYDKMDISVSKWESGFYIGSLFDSMGKRILTKKIIISH
jgi:hypothetical protein